MRYQCAECQHAYEYPESRTMAQLFCSDPACGGELETVSLESAGEFVPAGGGAKIEAWPGLVFGSGPDATVKLDAPSVSPLHAALTGEGDQLFLRDLNSAHGTWVNGLRVVERPLRHGDMVKLGDVELRFVSRQQSMAGEGLVLLADTGPGETIHAESARSAPPVQEGAGGTANLEAVVRQQGKLVKALAATAKFSLDGDENMLIQHLIEHVFDIFPAERAALLINHEQTRRRRTVARTRDGKPLDEMIAVSRSLAKKVLDEKIAMVVGDAATDSRMPNVASVLLKGIRSILVAPIMFGEKVMGLLWADCVQQSRAFSADDLPVFSGLAAAAGSAISSLRSASKMRLNSVALRRLSGTIPQNMIPEVMTRRVTMPIGGETREVSVLFCELVGFDEGERLSPQELVGGLNDFLGRMAEVILEHGGMVDKMVGESLMALWGMPVATPEDPARAVQAALAMQKTLDEVNAGAEAAGRPVLRMSIGVHTGRATVGNIGSPSKMEWSAVGSAVKLASRIQSTAPAGQVRVSLPTHERIRESFKTEALPDVRFNESSAPVPVFKVTA
ncbi:MAG: FHA domain-containing protein [Candidatus Wallbacteria bacterium]|nr:FHA domain-containing protein [Candidatus Wallbacteria bacterium]